MQLQIFSDVVWHLEISIAGQLIVSVSPRFSFIMVVIIIYLFVLDDSLTSQRFTTRTEQVCKCCEPLQKMRVRLGDCETGLSPLLFYITDRSKAILLLWF